MHMTIIAIAVAASIAVTQQSSQKADSGLENELKQYVYMLAEKIGERNLTDYEGLNQAADYITAEFASTGISPQTQSYQVQSGSLRRKWRQYNYDKQIYRNIVLEIKGTAKPEEIIVVGAHYDSVPIKGCLAANDNASGVAALLAIARHFATNPQKKTLRFVAFTNEEPPFFWKAGMGSMVYAKKCRADGDNIRGMLSLETIGCYSDEEDSQRYPLPLFSTIFPSKGNFIAFVTDSKSKQFQQDCLSSFKKHSTFPAEGAALPLTVPRIGASDHFAFRKAGYPGLMVTDTAPYRDRTYHTDKDNPDHLDYARMAVVVEGLKGVITDISN